MHVEDRPKAPALALSNEQGSLPLALLMVIIFAGLMTAVIATTITGQRSARFDRDYMQVISGADAGVQEVLFRINSGALPVESLKADRQCGEDTLNGMDYRWCAEAVDEDGKLIEVATRATLNGVARTVVAELEEMPAVPFVVFTHLDANLPGANIVDSFDSRVTSCPGGGWGCAWGMGGGIIATNDTIRIGGSSSGVDAIHLYDWDNNPDWERCEQTGTGGGTSLCTNPEPDPKRPRLDYKPDMLFIEEVFEGPPATQCPEGQRLNQWRASQEGGAPQQSQTAKLGPPVRPDGSPAEYYCVDDLVFDRHTQLVNAAGQPLTTSDPPIIVYVKESVNVRQGRKVGCVDCAPYGKPPLPTHLRIYSISGEVDIRNQSEVATILFAPNALCGVTSNAQVTLYGAMICDRVNNQGGWQFYYDNALFDDGTGRYTIESWREEPGLQVEL